MTTAKNFVNFHVLISHSPSCLNRDDMNMQKTAIFGGVKRVRISSQSLKRAMRTSPYYAARLGTPSVRTLKLDKLRIKFQAKLVGRFEPAVIDQALALLAGTEGIVEGAETSAVSPWSLDEVAFFCERVAAAQAEGVDAKKLEKEIEKNARPFRAAMASAVDIALSGRMATSGLMTSLPVDGALALAHAITTHAVEPQDVDWFTAVDDLKQEEHDPGAGHLNTQEFSAGVFYRYASLNLKQLQVNLGLIDDIHSPETAESRAKALEIAKHLLHLLATVVPSAKRQPFAADNLAEFAIVSFSDVPVSLANAFEKPVKRANSGGGYLAPSQRVMAGYWEKLNRAYGLDEQAAAFRFDDAPWTEETKGANALSWPEKLTTLDTLPALENWIAADGQA